MRDLEIAGAIVLGLVILGGGGALAVRVIDRRQMETLLRDAAVRWGLDPNLLVAIAIVESNLDPHARNERGADGARGGAYGATQITLATAHAYGWAGSAAELLDSPAMQAELTAQIIAAGKVTTIEDAGAWWNAGRRTFAALPPDNTARTTYVPRLIAAYEEITA